MKKRYFYISLVVLVLILVAPKLIAYSTTKKEANSLEPYVNFNKGVVNEEKPYVNFYNGDGQLIDSYSQDQIDESLVEASIYKPSKESVEGKPFAIFYDEDGLPLDPDEDIEKEIKELSGENKHKLFVFRSTSFVNSISIGQDRTFYKPESIIIEPELYSGPILINLFDSTGQKTRTIAIGNIPGGIKVPLTNYVEDESYSIQLVSEKQGEQIKIWGGVVTFN